MTTITREQQKQILIDTANHVISRDNTSPYSENLRELARIALASLTAEPVAWTDAEELRDLRTVGFCEMFTVEPVSKDADMYRVIPLYTDSPVPERERIRREHAEWSDADPVVFTDERNLRHIASGRETSLIWGKQNQEVGDIPLYRHAQSVPVVPDEMATSDDMNLYQKSFAQGYNACRNAMLNGGKS